jgi:hypothetical protein
MRTTLGSALAALTTILALAAAAPASSYAHSWELNGVPLTRSVVFTGTGEWKFGETALQQTFNCPVLQSGTVGPGALGQITSVGEGTNHVLSCSSTGRRDECGGAVHVEALNLPWHTELATVNGKLSYVVLGGGVNPPEWKFKCANETLFHYKERCEATSTASAFDETGGVGTELPSSGREVTCLESSAKLTTEGTLLMKASAGGTLAVN